MVVIERVQIDSLGKHGEGVARYRDKPLFVEGALPGEEVEVKIGLEKQTYVVGHLLHIVRPSPLRQIAPCPVFLKCGGCQLQHLQPAGQLAWKQERVAKALHDAGIDTSVPPCQPSPHSWHYRCKMLMPIQGNRLGLYALNSHQLVPVTACLVHCRPGERIHQTLQAWLDVRGPFSELKHCLLRTSSSTGAVLMVLVVSHLDIELWKQRAEDLASFIRQSGEPGLDGPGLVGIVANLQPDASNTVLGRNSCLLWGCAEVEDMIAGIPVRISATSFFQVNPPQADRIAQRVLSWAAQHPSSRLCDLFCGAGAVALSLARQGHAVTGVDTVPSAISDAQATAAALGLEARFYCARAEQWLAEHADNWDGLLLNPPRKGCDASLLQAILRSRPRRLCMISCNPDSLGRDLAMLRTRYDILEVQPYDLFPQTAHVETLTTLELRTSV